MRTVWLLLFAIAGCGDDGDSPPNNPPDAAVDSSPSVDADTRDVLDRLESLPGVTASEFICRYGYGQRCFDLTFEQPVDHEATGSATFTQRVTLIHIGLDKPMTAVTTGYWNFYQDYPYELTLLLGSNQITIEHRFFAASRPSPADWSKLTIKQSATDQHRITELLQTIYDKPWVTTGASKGGMTASYHRRFFPDDVAGTVPYVAPLSLAAGDSRYATFLDSNGTAACRQSLRAIAVEMLETARFEALVSRAQAQSNANGTTFQRVALRPAVESAITGVEWSFWQYGGAAFCSQVPTINATDDALWAFLDRFSGVTSDADLNLFDAYYFQAVHELGYPDDGTADYLAGKTRYTGADYAGAHPPGAPQPEYRPEAMADIDQWTRTEASRFLFVYGELDPWTGGMYELGAAMDSQRSIAPQANHGAGLVDLGPTDKLVAFDKLEAWTGVRPDETRLKRRALPALSSPRVPPPVLRALSMRSH